jgi:hypothetical protein
VHTTIATMPAISTVNPPTPIIIAPAIIMGSCPFANTKIGIPTVHATIKPITGMRHGRKEQNPGR